MINSYLPEMITKSAEAQKVIRDLFDHVDPVHIETVSSDYMDSVHNIMTDYFVMIEAMKFAQKCPSYTESMYKCFTDRFTSMLKTIKLVIACNKGYRIDSSLDKYLNEVE